MGNKGEDTGKVSVTSKEKTFFLKKLFSSKRIGRLLSKIISFKYITKLSF